MSTFCLLLRPSRLVVSRSIKLCLHLRCGERFVVFECLELVIWHADRGQTTTSGTHKCGVRYMACSSSFTFRHGPTSGDSVSTIVVTPVHLVRAMPGRFGRGHYATAHAIVLGRIRPVSRLRGLYVRVHRCWSVNCRRWSSAHWSSSDPRWRTDV